MAAVSTSDIQYLSKVLYPKGYKDKDLYWNLPLTASMKKSTDFTSARGIEVQVDYALSNGIGGTMTGAVANATTTYGSTFTVPQVHQYGYAFLDGVVMRNAEQAGDDGKVIDYAKKQFNDGMHALMAEVERQAFRSKTGAIAQCSATTAPSGSTITLASAADCIFFRKGMIIVATVSVDGGALAAGTPGYATVTAVDPAVPSITVDGTITTQITGITTGSYLYRSTLADNNSTGNGGFAGLGNWNPITPSSSFYGVNQQTNPTMLAGVRVTDTSNLETLFLRAKARAMGEVGAGYKTGEIYLHPWQFMALVSTKIGAVQITDQRSVELGITKMQLGPFTFVEAPFCPIGYAHIVAEKNLELHTCGKQPVIGKVFDDPDVDQAKVKLNLDGNILTFAPCQNVRAALPTVSIT